MNKKKIYLFDSRKSTMLCWVNNYRYPAAHLHLLERCTAVEQTVVRRTVASQQEGLG